MTELLIYSILLIAVLAHLGMTILMYKKINSNKTLSFHEKNQWRLRALVFPAYYWFAFQKKK